ncbi:MAG: hypothetical protein Q8K59_11070 [Nitrosomonas sp.]|nr:hypothetical protein [Nitrosomonas sp.]MDP1951612.1 hypothetical protein [Nitrosomonas sp.]
MQNHDKPTTVCVFSHPGFIHLYLSTPLFLLILFIFLQLASSSVAAADAEIETSFNQQRFLVTEIEGISLSTPLEAIPAILENQGYNQTGPTTYTKQSQEPGQRKSVYRIEIEDTTTLRQITYFRGKSGGRIKSPATQEKPIPSNEATIAREIYHLVCNETSAQIQTARSCLPITESNISFGQGDLLEIGHQVGVQLSASATNTTITLKYRKD